MGQLTLLLAGCLSSSLCGLLHRISSVSSRLGSWLPLEVLQQIIAGFIPGSPFSWSGMLHSNPGDYAWGQTGLDAIVTQLLGQLENTGPPPADKEKITSLPTVTVTQEQVGKECNLIRPEIESDLGSSGRYDWIGRHDACPVCRKSLNGEDSTQQTQTSGPSASNRFSSDSQLHDRWTF
ncbi:hypothetical protein J1605_022840 [Eschrichtius robustus]|uniref:E3 ubiquitin-protein ligase n=1 Tax=Eschrichtius robustus TaxID=9764 RepID=A0AB34H5W3_ESCRO|nr:hypothetical protein J1605_022840 [Eschrichtius robustus]